MVVKNSCMVADNSPMLGESTVLERGTLEEISVIVADNSQIVADRSLKLGSSEVCLSNSR